MSENKFAWDLDNDIEILPDEGGKRPQDPRNAKRKRMLTKTFFGGDAGLFEEFATLYDEFVKQHSRIPFERALIAFREKYEELPDGGWRKK
jgi:hypothetical protein